jgi:hypothetical protein
VVGLISSADEYYDLGLVVEVDSELEDACVWTVLSLKGFMVKVRRQR